MSKTKVYLPRYYGLTEYGASKKNSILPGESIDLNFVGTLREVQQTTIDLGTQDVRYSIQDLNEMLNY
jgi:hypothetical protein